MKKIYKEVVIGFKLTKKLKLKLGQKVILTTQDINGDIVSINLKIRSIIMLESFILGILGFIIGSILGGMTLYYYSTYRLDLSNFASLDEFGVDSIIYTSLKWNIFIHLLYQ